MRKSGWMSRSKALAASTVLACGVLGLSSAAQADYSYTFSVTPLSGSIGGASGAFTTNNVVSGSNALYTLTSGSYNFSLNGGNYSGSIQNGGSFISFGVASIAGFGLSPSNSLSLLGPISSYTNSGFSGIVQAVESATPGSGPVAAVGGGFFQAFLSGSPGSGGGSGGSGGGSGGAPSPEVNAGLSLLLAGSAFVFLRRRRGGQASADGV